MCVVAHVSLHPLELALLHALSFFHPTFSPFVTLLVLSSSLRTPLCLKYSPSMICVAAIRLAMRHLITRNELVQEPVKHKQSTLALAPIERNIGTATHHKPWYEELFGMQKKEIDSQ